MAAERIAVIPPSRKNQLSRRNGVRPRGKLNKKSTELGAKELRLRLLEKYALLY
jgi:hypothetical protein